MASVHDFIMTRTTMPNGPALLARLRADVDPLALVGPLSQTRLRVKKPTPWTAPQIAAAQNAIDTAPASSPRLTAQDKVDQMDVFDKAILLTVLDQMNFIRARLPTPLAAITVDQMIAAVRTKAGTL